MSNKPAQARRYLCRLFSRVTLPVGLCCAAVSIAAELLRIGEGDRVSVPCSPLLYGLAAFFTSAAMWRFHVARRNKRGLANGLKAGLAGGLFHYFVLWCCIQFAMVLSSILQANGFSGFLEKLALTLMIPITAGIVAFGDFRYVGWLTIPAFGLVGAALGWWYGRFPSAGPKDSETALP